ncbi:hypothetical protein ACHAP9_003641 [Verticillium nonalfalfae]
MAAPEEAQGQGPDAKATERPTSDIFDMDKVERASSIATTMDPSAHGDLNRDRDHGYLEPSRFSLSRAGHISLDDVEAVDVEIRSLAVTVDTSPSWFEPSTCPDLAKQRFKPTPASKTLLHHVDASLAHGTLTAIIGGSGSGKTTLLNTMSERMISSRLSQAGSIRFNGNDTVQTVRHAYVMQQDILLPTLTVRETLQYSADLRLPPPTTAEERTRIVEEVILELGLKECADTRIGNHQHRGCSGGEKRRVSIGVQLLANPSVLFLDEPTTGLDATSAFQLVRTLKSLATKGRTIVTTIHQPRSEIWDLFDNLIILTRGSPVYSGPAKDCTTWFEGQGFRLPPFVNPAEYLIDVAAIDNRTPELEGESTARVDRLKAAWTEQSQTIFPPREQSAVQTTSHRERRAQATKHATYGRQLRMLTNRTFKVTYRDPMGMLAAVVEAVLMGLVTGYIFYNLPRDDSGIRSRQGGLYTAAGLQGYLILIFEIYRLSIDMPTFDREHTEHCVDAIPFLLSRRFARLFTEDFPVPFLFSVIFYFMAGFERDASQFLIFFSITLLNHYIAMTCAMTCVTACRNFPGASLIANLIYTMQSMACGMFVQAESIPVYVRWMKHITYTYYAFSAYCGNEFEGAFYDCPLPGGQSDPACYQYTGEFIMESLGFPQNWVWRPIVIMTAFVIFFCILSAVGLQFVPVEMTIARARNSDTDLSAGKEKMRAKSISEVRTIDVGLDNFALALDKRSVFGKKQPTKTILNPVDATFQAGVLNIIMGPSGSGKTSLLNAMALRLHNNIGTQYRPAGKLTFNGAVPSNAVIRSICSYVCQDDDALLPSLTVRETLRFSAGLRLPSWMTKEEKIKRAEEVLLKMGLKDCADNLVGSDLIKGISGGEKRRVTIAVQLLSDPRVLLLDEPTSGLDAFTANSIMEVLQGLAMEGRTLILTIHQARSDLFKHFGNVLLLARGGSPAYAGSAKEMLAYFNRQGFECPSHTNPADFALDLITIDLQQADREADSREKVRLLVEAWQDHLRTPVDMEKHEAHATLLSGIEEKAEDDADNIAWGISSSEKTRSRENENEDELHISSASKTGHEAHHRPAVPPPRQSFNKATLATPAELGALVRKRASFAAAAPLLMHRAFINFRRQPPLLLARTMQVIGLGLVLSLFFAPLKHDLISVQNRMGFVQQVGAFYFVGMLQNVAVYPAERDVYYREDDDGVYGVEAFLASYTFLEIPFEVISSLLFGVLAVLAVGFPRTAEMYFTMAGVLSIDMPEFLKALNFLSPIREQCPQSAPIRPLLSTSNLVDMESHIASHAFRDATVARLAGAIKIRTETFDDMGALGEDPRWLVFGDFERYLRQTFPLVHKVLSLEHVNTHGLLYTWRGTEPALKPTVLMAHQDVVPVPNATIGQWQQPPFSGAFDGTYIWGRGTVDCKNTLIGILESVELLVEAGFRPRRTAVLSFGFDEEVSGPQGAAHLAPFLVDRYGKHGAALILDEGAGIIPTWGKLFALPGVSEKGYLDVEIIIRAPGGHSSMPPAHTSVGIAAELVSAIESEPYPPAFHDENPFLDFLRCGAAHVAEFPTPVRMLLPKRGENTILLGFRKSLLAKLVARGGELIRSLFTTTQAVDVVHGGVKVNALPERTGIKINHRINIGETSDTIKAKLSRLAGHVASKHGLALHAFDDEAESPSSITLRVEGSILEPAPVTPTGLEEGRRSTPWAILSGTTKALYGDHVIVAPGLMPANTDTKFYWDLSRSIFRHFPGWDPEYDTLDGIHTVNEKISVSGHIKTVQWYSLFLRNMDEADMN